MRPTRAAPSRGAGRYCPEPARSSFGPFTLPEPPPLAGSASTAVYAVARFRQPRSVTHTTDRLPQSSSIGAIHRRVSTLPALLDTPGSVPAQRSPVQPGLTTRTVGSGDRRNRVQLVSYGDHQLVPLPTQDFVEQRTGTRSSQFMALDRGLIVDFSVDLKTNRLLSIDFNPGIVLADKLPVSAVRAK